MLNKLGCKPRTSDRSGRLVVAFAAGTVFLAFLSACQDASLTGTTDPKGALIAQGAVTPDIRPDVIKADGDSAACHSKDLNIAAKCQDKTSTVVVAVPVYDGTQPVLPNGMPVSTPSDGEIGQSQVEAGSGSAPVPDTAKYDHGGPILLP